MKKKKCKRVRRSQTKKKKTIASLCCHFKSRNYSVAIAAMRSNVSMMSPGHKQTLLQFNIFDALEIHVEIARKWNHFSSRVSIGRFTRHSTPGSGRLTRTTTLQTPPHLSKLYYNYRTSFRYGIQNHLELQQTKNVYKANKNLEFFKIRVLVGCIFPKNN